MPDLVLNEAEPTYGMLRKQFLNEHRSAEYIENAELKCKGAICKDIAVLRPYINCKKVRA